MTFMKVYVECKYTHLHIMTSSVGGPLQFHNIQEIVDILN